MAPRGISFTNPLLDAMTVGLRAPLGAAVGDPSTSLGLGSLQTTAVDNVVQGAPPGGMQSFGAPSMTPDLPRLGAAPAARAPFAADPNAPVRLYNPTTNRMYVNGFEFDAQDPESALKSQSYLSAPPVPPTTPGWQPISADIYQQYLADFGNRRSTKALLWQGARDTAASLVGGTGRALEILGEPDAGKAVANFAEDYLAPSQYEQQRSALIAQNSTLWEQIVDGAISGVPSFLASALAGGGGALIGARYAASGLKAAAEIRRARQIGSTIGSLAGAGATVFPMELQGLYDQAVQGGYDTSDPTVQTEMVAAAAGSSFLQAFAPAMVGRGFSQFFSTALRNAAATKTRGMLANAGRHAVIGSLEEGLSEAAAQIIQMATFDPEFRAQLNQNDIKALVPYIVEAYGKDALVAFGAGAILGGVLGGGANLRSTKAPIDLTQRNGEAPLLALPPPPLITPAPATPAHMQMPPRTLVQGVDPNAVAPAADPNIMQQQAAAAQAANSNATPTAVQQQAVAPAAVAQAPNVLIAQQQAAQQAAAPTSVAQAAPAAAVQAPNVLVAQQQAVQQAAAPAAAPNKLKRVSAKVAALQAAATAAPQAAVSNDYGEPDINLEERFVPQQDKNLLATRAAEVRQMQEQAPVTAPVITPEVSQQPPAVAEQAPTLADNLTIDDAPAPPPAPPGLPPAEAQALWHSAQLGNDVADSPGVILSWAELSPEGRALWATVADGSAPIKGLIRVAETLSEKYFADATNPADATMDAYDLVTTTDVAKVTDAYKDAISRLVKAVADKEEAGSGTTGTEVRRKAVDLLLQTDEFSPSQLETIREAIRIELGSGDLGNKKKAQVAVRGKGVEKGTKMITPLYAVVTKLGMAKELRSRFTDIPVGVLGETDPGGDTADTNSDVEAGPAAAFAGFVTSLNLRKDPRPLSRGEQELFRSYVAQVKAAAVADPELWNFLVDGNAPLYQYIAPNGLPYTHAGRLVPNASAVNPITVPRKTGTVAAAAGDPGRVVDVSAATKHILEVRAQSSAEGKGKQSLLAPKSRRQAAVDTRSVRDLVAGLNTEAAKKGVSLAPLPKKDGAFSLADWNTLDGATDTDGRPATPLSAGTVMIAAKGMAMRFAKAPTITVARDQADLKRNHPKLYAEAVKARPQGDFDTANALGYSFGSNVVLFSGRFSNLQAVRRVLAHEALGHFGLRSIMPIGKFTTMMNMVYDADVHAQPMIDAAVAARNMTRAEATEEYLADMAAKLDTRVVARIWAQIKTFLNRLGVQFDDDLARYLISQSRAYVRNGKTSGAIDMQTIMRRVHAVNTGEEPGTGRFSLASIGRTIDDPGFGDRSNTDDYAAAIGEMMRRGEGWVKHDLAEKWDTFKANVFSPTRWRALRNQGFHMVMQLVTERSQVAAAIKAEFGSMRHLMLRPRAEFLSRLGIKTKGISDDQMTFVNNHLRGGRLRMSSRTARKKIADLLSTRRRETIMQFNPATGEWDVNTDFVQLISAMSRVTPEQMRDGYDYEFLSYVEMTDEIRAQIEAKRDAELVAARDDKQREEIAERYEQQLAAGVYETTETHRVAGDKDITADSIEYMAYKADFDAMVEIRVRELHSKYSILSEEKHKTYALIRTIMNAPMTEGDKQLIDAAAAAYVAISEVGSEVDDSGLRMRSGKAITKAGEFIEHFNKALLGHEGAADEALKAFPEAARATVAAQLEDFKTRFAPKKLKKGDTGVTDQNTRGEIFVVQNQIVQIASVMLGVTDYEVSAAREIASGYVPFDREGTHQVRAVATDSKGVVHAISDRMRNTLPYLQTFSKSEAISAAARIQALYGSDPVTLEVWDTDLKKFVAKPVTLTFRHEAAQVATSVDPAVNIHEFFAGLRRFGMTPDPAKQKELILAMTMQNERSYRRRLQAAFVPGVDRDTTKAISRYIETKASLIARNTTSVRLTTLLDERIRDTHQKWNGSPVEYERLKKEYEAAEASPDQSPAMQAKRELAKRAYDQYHYWYKTNDAEHNGNAFFNEAQRLLTFLDQQKEVNETDLARGEVVSKLRMWTSLAMLGGSAATGSLNLLSLYTNTLAALSSFNSKTGFGGGFGWQALHTMNRLTRIVGAPGLVPGAKGAEYSTFEFWRRLKDSELKRMGIDRAEANFLADGIESGALQAAQFNALSGSARGNITSGNAQRALDIWMWTFNATEQASRRVAGLSAYRLMKERLRTAGTYSEAEADRIARNFADDIIANTLGDYGIANRPALLRGGVQQFAFMFKMFPINSAALLANMDPKGKAIMLLGILALSGLRGIPFAEDLEDIFDTLAQKLGFAHKTGASVRVQIAKIVDSVIPGASSIVLGGAVNRMLSADVGIRTAMGNMVPGTGILLAGADKWREGSEIAGPLLSFAQGLGATVLNAARVVRGQPGAKMDLLRNSPVTMLRAAADAVAYTQSGAIVDKRGYVVSEEGWLAAAASRVLGFYPTAASRQYDAIKFASRASEYQKSVAAMYRVAYVRAFVQGDRDEMRTVVQEVKEWNASAKGSGLEIPNFVANAQRAIRTARDSLSDRFLKSSSKTNRDYTEQVLALLGD